MPKTTAKSKSKSSIGLVKVGRLKFDKTLLIVIAAVVVATGGYLFYRGTHASSANPYSCPAPQPQIQGFSQGTCVKYLQFVLKNYASQTPVTVSGSFDQATVNGVKNVQHIAGLPQDGIVGPKTWSVINSLNADHVSAPAPTSATYYTDSPGIAHETGSFFGTTGEILNGTKQVLKTWNWYPASSTTRFLQFGPYATLRVPTGSQGFRVCYDYDTSANFKGDYSVTVYTDTTYTSSNSRIVVGAVSKRVVASSDNRVEDYGTIVAHCSNVALSPGTYKNMEFRLKVTAEIEPFGDGELRLYRTRVSPY